MPPFKRADHSAKPDKQGKIAVRIFLLDEKKQQDCFPVSGNRREDFFIEDATVGEVHALLKKVLFEDEEIG